MTDETAPVLAGPSLPVPSGFTRDVLDRSWQIDHPTHAVWGWLCDPRTFTHTQIPPYRVEFVDPVTGGPAGFGVGVLTTHHGPLLHFCGVITEVDHERYRDLQYTYGAYALSMRLARPVRLEFWVEAGATPATSMLRLRVTADVRDWFVTVWRFGNRVFWSRFGRWCSRSLDRR